MCMFYVIRLLCVQVLDTFFCFSGIDYPSDRVTVAMRKNWPPVYIIEASTKTAANGWEIHRKTIGFDFFI